MSVIAVGGFQHETNTFAPSKADFAAFANGGGWPELCFGDAIAPRLAGANIPATGAIDALHASGHRTIGLAWGAASPSAQVTRDAYERIVGEMLARLAEAGPVDGVYLDLHGAMVTEHLDDGEGELLARVRRVVGPRVPVVASLDLHANLTRAMMTQADGFAAYRTYPHIDMAAAGARAARLLERTLARRPARWPRRCAPLDFLTGLSSQSTFIEPGRRLYEHARAAGTRTRHRCCRSPRDFRWPIFRSARWRSAATVPTRRARSARSMRWRRRSTTPNRSSRSTSIEPDAAVARAAAARRARRTGACSPTRRTIPAPAATATPPDCSRRCWRMTRATRCSAC